MLPRPLVQKSDWACPNGLTDRATYLSDKSRVKMTDFTHLTIAIDSKSAKVARSEMQKLGAAADVAETKVAKVCKGMASLFGNMGTEKVAKEVTELGIRYNILGVAMSAAEQNAIQMLGQAQSVVLGKAV
jgi:hypothetical protein